MTKKRFDDGTFIFADDGSLYLHVHDRATLAVASKRFSASQALAVRNWLLGPDTDWEADTTPYSGLATIGYSHEDGLLHVGSRHGDSCYDPNNDEALARLVRRLKSLAPMPRHDPAPTLPGLPSPTPEQLANATRYSRAMPAQGYSGQGGRRVAKRTATPARAKERLDSLLSDLVGARRKA